MARVLVRKAYYDGKAAGRDLRNYLRPCVSHLKFRPCLDGTSAWTRLDVKSDSSNLRKDIGKCFELKEESIELTKMCLGRHSRK